MDLSSYFLETLRRNLAAHQISPALLFLPPHLAISHPETDSDPSTLPTPIIPVLTPHPRPLSAHLRVRGLNARPITWPTVPKGADRIRVCLHANNTREDVDRLLSGMIEWAESWDVAQNTGKSGTAVHPSAAVQAKL